MDINLSSLFTTTVVIGGSTVLLSKLYFNNTKNGTTNNTNTNRWNNYWKLIFIISCTCILFITSNLLHPTASDYVFIKPVLIEAEDEVLELIGTDDLCEKSLKESITTQQEIFFLETSGEECLTARQACSVESASRANPEADVVVYMEGAGPLTGEWYKKWKEERKDVPVCTRSCSITKTLLNHYSNIRIVREDLLVHLEKTPLEPLLSKDHQSGGIRHGHFPLAQRSDLVRVALMWKRGGMYLDLDVVVYRPLYCLKNTIGLKDWVSVGGRNWVENSVMTFTAGNPYLKFLMDYQEENYRPDEYFSLGPPALTVSLMEFCETDDLPDPRTGGPLNCNEDSVIDFQPLNAFFALDNWDRNVFFSEMALKEDLKALNESYLSHIFDAKNGLATPKGSLYARLAETYCPVTYKMAMEELGVF